MRKPIKINNILQFVTLDDVQGQQAEVHPTLPFYEEQKPVITISYIEQQAREFIKECNSLGILSEAEE